MIGGIAQTIMTRPMENWLVVHHKDKGREDFQNDLVEHIPSAVFERVHFLHWGDHHGTNAFAHVENVILAGTWFFPEYVYEGLARLSAGKCDEEEVGPPLLRKVKKGEHAHAILQALCRTAVRGITKDGKCQPCQAYIIASKRSGIPELLTKLFPGCALRDWTPTPRTLKGKLKLAVEYLDGFFDVDPTGILTFKELAFAVGMERKNFNRVIRHDQRFQDAIHARNLEEVEVGARRSKGLAALTSPFPVEECKGTYVNRYAL